MAIPAPDWGPIADDCQSIRSYPCIECRLLGRAATPPRPLFLLPPLVAVLPDRYKMSNRKLNCYSMLMISTHKYIQKYIQTYKHAYMHAYIQSYYIHIYIHSIHPLSNFYSYIMQHAREIMEMKIEKHLSLIVW